jgi:hypothetical protein
VLKLEPVPLVIVTLEKSIPQSGKSFVKKLANEMADEGFD